VNAVAAGVIFLADSDIHFVVGACNDQSTSRQDLGLLTQWPRFLHIHLLGDAAFFAANYFQSAKNIKKMG
jgi:hypothetical protein